MDVFLRVFLGTSKFATRKERAWGHLHALQRPGPSTAQGNLLALQLQLTVGCLLNFVVDLIQSLVIDQENHLKIVMLSDALKKGMSHQDQIERTSDMNS